jgi:UDP-N-acetylglucosamine 2-epimerase (non-hydrolysing)/GDP/UDP-N,N'-diacetylbacillosamine 2-epimerase (hydrolysing)
MADKRIIAIFTGNRAEYGLLSPIIRAVADHPGLEYRLLVSGAHLDEDFGATKREIEGDGFSVHAEIIMETTGDTLHGTVRSIGSCILSMAEALVVMRPDLFLVYADRFEGLAACVAGTQMGIPTVHVEGGDLTEGGALDDCVRHAMTKLAHLHFTTNEQAAERVRRLGEEPWRVFNTGFPAIDLIRRGNYASPQELAALYDIDLERPVVLFTQHSVTTEFEQAADQVLPSLEALRRLATKGVQLVLTYPNNDAGGGRIIRELEAFRAEVPGLVLERSLGRYNYYGILNLCGSAGRGVCAGNSSSGIKETPAFGSPAVNIGSRQQGRLRGDNVLDAPYEVDAIETALSTALWDEEFRTRCREGANPYGEGNTGARIAEVLATIELGPRICRKLMTY